MNFRLTLSMVIVLVLVLIGYLAFKNHQQNAKTEDATAKNLLISPAPKEIKSVTYTQDGEKQMAFDKGASGWNLSYPTTAPANTYEIEPIADGLKTLSYKEKFEPEASGVKSAEETGTDKPHNVITWSDDAGKQHRLDLGKATIGGIFATLDGGKTIYLLSSNPLDALQKDPNDFRNRTIKDSPAEKIAGIEIKRKEGTLSLSKTGGDKGGDKWLITSPISARANRATADELVNEMKDIHAFGFSDLAKNSPATGLNPPVLTVTAQVEEGSAPTTTAPATGPATQAAKTEKTAPVTLELGYYTDLTKKNAVYASLAGSDQVFTVAADTFKKLDRQLKDLRDPAITPAPVANATEISINRLQSNGGNLIAKKEGEKWMLESYHRPVQLGTAEINTLLSDIANLRAINYSDDAGNLKAIGLDPPQATISLTVPGQSQKEVILIGKAETADKVTPVMRQGEPTVYLVQTAEVEKVLPTVLSLKDKTVDKLTADSIRTIEVSGEKNFTLQREGSTWTVTEKGGKAEKADDVKITTLLGDFSPLTAAAYVGDDVQENWHLPAKADLTVTITSQETEAAATQPTTLAAKPVGPMPAHAVTHTLKLYKDAKANKWKGVWEGGTQPQWLFEPTAGLVTQLTGTSYAVPATQPASQPATTPAVQ